MLQLHRRPCTLRGILAVIALVSAASARADCPVTDMRFNAEPTFSSSSAAFDTVVSATKQAGYDVPAARLSLRHVVSGAEVAHADVGVPILFFAGMWKEIAITLGARGSADHLVAATATFRFTALPSGAGVTSCRGFVQAPTPAPAASWGSVKAAYR